jgi:hypothetical protein
LTPRTRSSRLSSLHRGALDAATLQETLGCILKVHEDRAVLDAHHAAIDPMLGGGSAAPRPGGHDLETDFGFGSVTAPRR